MSMGGFGTRMGLGGCAVTTHPGTLACAHTPLAQASAVQLLPSSAQAVPFATAGWVHAPAAQRSTVQSLPSLAQAVPFVTAGWAQVPFEHESSVQPFPSSVQ